MSTLDTKLNIIDYSISYDIGDAQDNWKNFRGNLFHTGQSANNGPTKNSVKFVYNIGNVQIISSPAVDRQGNIYFGSQDGYLYKISSSGSFIWKSQSSGIGSFASSPALSYNEDVVYCGNSDSYLYAMSTSTGSHVWKFNALGVITTSPYVHGAGNDGIVFISCALVYTFVLNATNITQYSSEFAGGPFDYSSPVFLNNSVYIGCQDGNVIALSYKMINKAMSLTQKWTFTTSGPIR